MGWGDLPPLPGIAAGVVSRPPQQTAVPCMSRGRGQELESCSHAKGLLGLTSNERHEN